MKKAFIQLHIAVFLAGFTGILGRLITLNEALLVWYRLVISSIILWIVYYFKKTKPRTTRAQIMNASCIGLLLMLHWVTFYAGIKISTISTALVCLSSMGFFTAILEPMILKKPYDMIEILLGLLVIVGIVIVFHFDPKYKTGIIISMISAFIASVFPVLNRGLLKDMDPGEATLYQLTGGAIFITVLMPVYLHYVPVDRLTPTFSDWMWIMVMAVACTVFAFDLFMKALQKISAFTVNLTYNLEPIYGIALAFLIYREDKTVSSGFYYGFALIIASVILQTIRLKKQTGRQAARVEI